MYHIEESFKIRTWFSWPYLKWMFFSTEGRISRSQMWLSFLFLSFVFFFVSVITIMPLLGLGILRTEKMFENFTKIISIFFFIANMFVMIKRLHDVNRTGKPVIVFILISIISTISVDSIVGLGFWMFALFILGIIMLFYYIYIFFFKGTYGFNDYGEDPCGDYDMFYEYYLGDEYYEDFNEKQAEMKKNEKPQNKPPVIPVDVESTHVSTVKSFTESDPDEKLELVIEKNER